MDSVEFCPCERRQALFGRPLSREMLAFQTPHNSEGRFFGHLSVINALLMFSMRIYNTWQDGIDAETATDGGL